MHKASFLTENIMCQEGMSRNIFENVSSIKCLCKANKQNNLFMGDTRGNSLNNLIKTFLFS